MADLERIKSIESDKVNRWCKDNGIESNTDLAFFFLNYQEALDAAGRAVADAWSMARHAAAPGLAVGVRGAVHVEQARPGTSSLPSREMPPAIRAQLRPSAALSRPVVKGGSLPASAYIQPGSERAPAEGESQLLASYHACGDSASTFFGGSSQRCIPLWWRWLVAVSLLH